MSSSAASASDPKKRSKFLSASASSLVNQVRRLGGGVAHKPTAASPSSAEPSSTPVAPATSPAVRLVQFPSSTGSMYEVDVEPFSSPPATTAADPESSADERRSASDAAAAAAAASPDEALDPSTHVEPSMPEPLPTPDLLDHIPPSPALPSAAEEAGDENTSEGGETADSARLGHLQAATVSSEPRVQVATDSSESMPPPPPPLKSPEQPSDSPQPPIHSSEPPLQPSKPSSVESLHLEHEAESTTEPPATEHDDEDEDEDADEETDEEPEAEEAHAPPRADSAPPPPPSPADNTHPLLVLTSAVARELEVLPSSSSTPAAQPWVYSPAHANVPPMSISVVDPDGLWPFLETPLLERMVNLQTGGARRAVFQARETLRGGPAASIFTRYKAPYLHLCLVRCETLQVYTSTVRPRLRAFVEDVSRREDPEWLLVVVESSKHSRKVLDKVKLEFGVARVCSVSVFDQARGGGGLDLFKQGVKGLRKPGAGDGQWGLLVGRIGSLLERAQATRFTAYTVEGGEDNFCAHFVAVENLAFAMLQADKLGRALELYDALEDKHLRLLQQGDPVVLKMASRDANAGLSLCFPDTVTAADFESIRHVEAFPARILDVTRFNFRDLVATSQVSGLQLSGYLFSRRMLLLLGLGLPWRAAQVARAFMMTTRTTLLRCGAEPDVVDAWFIAAALEVVAATHGCAAVFASGVSAADRVLLSGAQAELLEQSVRALDAIVARKRTDWTEWPRGLARALQGQLMLDRLLEAGAAHAVAAGRFRHAARLTHRRGVLLKDENLLLDAARWWGGGPRFVVDGPAQWHDDWPSLRALSAELVPAVLLEGFMPVMDASTLRRPQLLAKVAEAGLLPVWVEHAQGGTHIIVRAMRGVTALPLLEHVRVRYASLDKEGVYVEALCEKIDESCFLVGHFEPQGVYGYFVPDEVVDQSGRKMCWRDKLVLEIPEPEQLAVISLEAPALVGAGCRAKEVLVFVDGTNGAAVNIGVRCGEGLVLLGDGGQAMGKEGLLPGVLGGASVWLKGEEGFVGRSFVECYVGKNKPVVKEVLVDPLLNRTVRVLVGEKAGGLLVALHLTPTFERVNITSMCLRGANGGELHKVWTRVPVELPAGEGCTFVWGMELEGSSGVKKRSLVPVEVVVEFFVGKEEFSSEWTLPILMKSGEGRVEKAMVGLRWGEDEEDEEGDDHPSLVLLQEEEG